MRYCHSAIYSQSLLVLLSFLWILRYDAIHFVRDLKELVLDVRLNLQKGPESF
jgi:hypothetical protein